MGYCIRPKTSYPNPVLQAEPRITRTDRWPTSTQRLPIASGLPQRRPEARVPRTSQLTGFRRFDLWDEFLALAASWIA
jgi:hypothetical protein